MAWLEDSLLGIASSDGYCSFIVFEGALAAEKIVSDNEENYYKVNGVDDK